MVFLFFLACMAVAAGAIVVGVPVFRRLERERLIRFIETNGNEEQKQRVKDLKFRQVELRLKKLEFKQAQEVLNVPEIQQQLEDANINVYHLKKILARPEADATLDELKKIDQEIGQTD